MNTSFLLIFSHNDENSFQDSNNNNNNNSPFSSPHSSPPPSPFLQIDFNLLQEKEESSNEENDVITPRDEYLQENNKLRSQSGIQLPKPKRLSGFWIGTGSAIDEDDPFEESTSMIQAVHCINNGKEELKTYKRRWIILLVYCITAMSNSLFWVTFSSITSSAEDFYQISLFFITCLFFIYLFNLHYFSYNYFIYNFFILHFLFYYFFYRKLK